MLDDPLSALDPRVGKHVFDRAIAPLAGRMTCIVATHALHFVHRFDRVLYLGEPGKITESGSFDDLVAADVGFAQLIRDHAASHSSAVTEAAVVAQDTKAEGQASDIMQVDSVSQIGTKWSCERECDRAS